MPNILIRSRATPTSSKAFVLTAFLVTCLMIGLPSFVVMGGQSSETTRGMIISEPLQGLTLWTELTIADEWQPSAHTESIQLAGFSTEPSNGQSKVSLVWRPEAAGGWFSTWKLQLHVEGFNDSSPHDVSRREINLMTLAPMRGHVYEAALSFDPNLGRIAVLVRDLTSVQRIVSKGVQLVPYDGMLYPSIPGDGLHGHVKRIEREFTPVDVQWNVVVKRDGVYVQADVLREDDDAALRIVGSGGHVPGRMQYHVEQFDQRSELIAVRDVGEEIIVPLNMADLPVGDFTVVMEYAYSDSVLMSEMIDLSRGEVEFHLVELGIDDSELHGAYEVRSEVSLTGVPFHLDAEMTQVEWDPSTTSYREIRQERVRLLDHSLDIEAGNRVVRFNERIPSGDEPSLWRIVFTPVLNYPIRTVTPNPEQLIAIGATDCGLDVMSFNIRVPSARDGLNAWPHRQEFVLDVIGQYAPDIIGFQEPVGTQLDFLDQHLVDYERVAVQADRVGVHNAIYFSPSRLERQIWGRFWLSDTPQVSESKTWGNNEARAVLWARFRVRDTGQVFYVLNTHFHHVDPTGDIGRRSAELIVERMQDIAGNLPVILLGDFNGNPWSAAYSTLVEEPGAPFSDVWRDAVVRRGPEGTFHGFSGYSGSDRIDWILVTPQITVNEAEHISVRRGDLFPSDHFPVFASLCFADES